MNTERKTFFMNPLSPPIPKRLGADDDYTEKFDKREAEWERKWNLAFSKTSAAKTDGLKKTETRIESPKEFVNRAWTNNSKSRDRLWIAEQLAPQNTRRFVQTELSKSENVRKATERLEKINQERKEPAEKPKEAEKPADVAQEAKNNLTEEAKDLLKALEERRTPAFVTSNLERILKENGFDQKDINGKTPDELIAMLDAKKRATGVPTAKSETEIKPKSPEAPKPTEDEVKKKAEEERQSKLAEERFRLERAVKEAERKGEEKGKEVGKEELWAKLKEKTSIFKKIKILFKRHPKEPKTEQEKVDKYKRDIYRIVALAGVGGALAALIGIALT